MPANSPSLADIVTVKADVVFKELSGEGVLLDLASGMYFGLDETSTTVAVDQRARVAAARVRRHARGVRRRARSPAAGLLNFVAELTRRNLVLLAGIPSGS